MKREIQYTKVLALLASLMLTAAVPACNTNPIPVESPVPARRAPTLNLTDARRLSDGANKLVDAMNKPRWPLHFSFKGRENINDHYPQDKTQSPQIGPVDLQADISPEEIHLKETRGKVTKTSNVKWGDETNWAMAKFTTLGVMTSPNFVIAVGSTVTSPPDTDLVGSTLADKFTFDTTTATPSQKMGLDVARAVLSTIKDCKGTAWVAIDSGLLIKFNLDADYVDKYGHAWTEHYEGEVTRK